MPHMQVIRARRPDTPVSTYIRISAVLVAGATLLAIGLAVAYVALSTPLVPQLSNLGAGRLGRPIAGTLVWSLAILIPGCLVVAGAAGLLRGVERSIALRQARPRPASSVASTVSSEYSVAQAVRLPDGRLLPEVVVGPHGVLLVEELPPLRATRRSGPYWEVRVRGQWRPLENPLERAARDAERLRNWLGSAEESFAPRTYVAVISDGHEVDRQGTVAVLSRDQLPAYLASMPPARQMDEERRARIVELLRGRM